MNIEDYIQSGIIQSNVLGYASKEEAKTLEALSLKHPEIKKAILDFELLMKKNVQENVSTVPEVQENSLNTKQDEIKKEESTPVTTISDKPKHDSTKSFSFWKYIAVATIILLLSSAAVNYYFYSNFKETKSNYDASVSDNNTLRANNELYKTKFKAFEEKIKMLENPEIKITQLRGLPGKENNTATIFWNSKTSEVYLLPTLTVAPSGKEYQLWAIVNGKPVDAGLLQDCPDEICKMKNMQQAEAFAITLENKGGSKTPDMNALYVIGKI